jgi:hypothetical protein
MMVTNGSSSIDSFHGEFLLKKLIAFISLRRNAGGYTESDDQVLNSFYGIPSDVVDTLSKSFASKSGTEKTFSVQDASFQNRIVK